MVNVDSGLKFQKDRSRQTLHEDVHKLEGRRHV
jgi:hypothetical protein